MVSTLVKHSGIGHLKQLCDIEMDINTETNGVQLLNILWKQIFDQNFGVALFNMIATLEYSYLIGTLE